MKKKSKKLLQPLKWKNFLLLLVAGTVNAFGVTMFLTPVGLYDSGISGLSHKKRDGFNRMIADALDGKIDLIVTKSLSRFARNTVDTLTTIRKLKSAGVEVFFEKD